MRMPKFFYTIVPRWVLVAIISVGLLLSTIFMIFYSREKRSNQPSVPVDDEIPVDTVPPVDDAILDDDTTSDDTTQDSETVPPKEEPLPITNPCKDPQTNANTSLPLSTEYVLKTETSVFNSAANAKTKSNPSLTYQPGTYTVFKCYDGMANITRTPGSPGGWIDPDNLSIISPNVPPNNPPPGQTTPPIDVMSLNNDRIGWSYAYPSQFITNYNGYWNYGDNNLYLTFDCGYDYNNLVSTILDTLKTKNVKAVFFVTGSFMNSRPDLIIRIVNEGHIVGNHSYNHLNLPNNLTTSTATVVDDLNAWEVKYAGIIGAAPVKKLFRPPEGVISVRAMGLLNQLGYKSLLWGAAYRDWDPANQPSQEEAMAALRQYTSAGDIILLHGVSQTSTSILPLYIDEYRAAGYGFALPN